mmetsp:Transcript_71074/g.118125  ORF Transcript_71074/g.118125 Transcript_71074/m.118125 type:complete len:356 (+) Transcript_71074:101-1168(+)|eukprot:CAMPEP_0119327842 /NCGR_PEP_ID=MMETSP1333-20130426/71812_1 /TAXON_ID=418940 /ORGANISM="Scyphosphaera apsteinii, Strain RCC1455" /LENGTH=355 /DNA_ID=CAMNT_0007336553 /DNA_START=97 /DNA_END=1164 /DNA_ORIENTATION=+
MTDATETPTPSDTTSPAPDQDIPAPAPAPHQDTPAPAPDMDQTIATDQHEAQLPMGPPLDEPGFPTLPMFAQEIAELSGAVVPQQLMMINYSPRERIGLSGMTLLGSHFQGGLGYNTPLGTLKADMVAAGPHQQLQTTLDGLTPLPFVPAQFTTQINFVKHNGALQLAMGTLQTVVFSPIGFMFGYVNLAGQTSAELVTGFPLAAGHQVLMGAHVWGVGGVYGGTKAALEWQQNVEVDGGEPMRLSTVTLACTRPHQGSDKQPSASLSITQRVGDGHSLAASFERTPTGSHVMWFGGTRQLEGSKLKGKWSTTGVLGLAVELLGDKSSLTLCVEANSNPGECLSPKFGASLQLSP